MNKPKIDSEDLMLLLCGLALTIGGNRIKKKQQDKAFKKRFDREMNRYLLEAKEEKGGQE